MEISEGGRHGIPRELPQVRGAAPARFRRQPFRPRPYDHARAAARMAYPPRMAAPSELRGNSTLHPCPGPPRCPLIPPVSLIPIPPARPGWARQPLFLVSQRRTGASHLRNRMPSHSRPHSSKKFGTPRPARSRPPSMTLPRCHRCLAKSSGASTRAADAPAPQNIRFPPWTPWAYLFTIVHGRSHGRWNDG